MVLLWLTLMMCGRAQIDGGEPPPPAEYVPTYYFLGF